MKTMTSSVLKQEEVPETANELRDFLRQHVRRALMAVFEQEIEGLCGSRYHPNPQAECYRSGSVPGAVFVEGRREEMRRPRVRRRTAGGGSEEVDLESWKHASDPGEWEAAMFRATLCGVSTRDVPALSAEKVRGQSRSSLSRLWQKKSAALVEEMQQSSLVGFDLLVLMLDAVVLSNDLVATVALGIDTEGRKRVLGFRVGSSENEEVCADLLVDLQERGLKPGKGRRLLAVLDGSKALKNALLRVWPEALVQRCLVHKERNIKGYLPRKHWKRLAALFARLRKAQGSEAAREAADEIKAFLANKNAQARQSFEEAGDDLLAFFSLEVPNTLNLSLLSTNAIENTFNNLRRHLGRVCRWREDGAQADRWLASGLTLASKGYRRIQGYKDLHHLEKALRESTR